MSRPRGKVHHRLRSKVVGKRWNTTIFADSRLLMSTIDVYMTDSDRVNLACTSRSTAISLRARQVYLTKAKLVSNPVEEDEWKPWDPSQWDPDATVFIPSPRQQLAAEICGHLLWLASIQDNKQKHRYFATAARQERVWREGQQALEEKCIALRQPTPLLPRHLATVMIKSNLALLHRDLQRQYVKQRKQTQPTAKRQRQKRTIRHRKR